MALGQIQASGLFVDGQQKPDEHGETGSSFSSSALESLAETLLDTLQGTLTLEMRIGIAAGNTGEIQIHHNRLVFTRPLSEWNSTTRSQTEVVVLVFKAVGFLLS